MMTPPTEIGPDDDLTPEQLTRVAEAVGRLGLIREAYRAGWSSAQVDDAQVEVTWTEGPTPPRLLELLFDSHDPEGEKD